MELPLSAREGVILSSSAFLPEVQREFGGKWGSKGTCPLAGVQGATALASKSAREGPLWGPPIALIGAWTATHVSGFVGQAPACPVVRPTLLKEG